MVRVLGVSDAIAISAGENSSYAITRDGRTWSWGYNIEGELGTGSPAANSDNAAPIPGLAGFQGIAGGVGSAVALRTDGTVWAWGRNFEGQLGDATFAQRNTPVLAVNATVSGPLDLNPQSVKTIPPDRIPPFFAAAHRAGDLSRLSVSTTTLFNAADLGKPGVVFVTAMVPSGSLAPAPSAMSGLRASALSASGATNLIPSADTASNSFALIQLTATGWQQVVNGQLIPYASGVIGDELAAQTILNGADTTNLGGAQFCVGYGTSADQMIALGTMRVVATIPDPNATAASASNCFVAGPPLSYSLSLPQGWNLLGNSLDQVLSVATLYSDPASVTSVWKWDAGTSGWQFYTPQMDAATLQTYASSKGYGVLTTINPGEGYWVNAKASPSPSTQSGAAFALTSVSLAKGWNLVATGVDVSPSVFDTNLKSSLPGSGVTTVWAWDNPTSRWYFYAPSLETQGGTALSDYIAGKDYLDFGSNSKMLGNGIGFWVNR
jgi:hypothetical protein